MLLVFGGILVCVFLFPSGIAKAAEIGVVVWKEQPFHNDASSRAFAYDRMKQSGPITWFYNGATGKSFEKHQLFQQMRFPQWPVGEIVDQHDFESLKFKLGELEAFSQKYPNAAVLLDGMIRSMRDAEGKFSSGKVFFGGSWITKEQYGNLAAQRNELLKKSSKEHEELGKKLRSQAEKASKHQEANTQQLSKWIQLAGGAWLLLLLLALLAKSKRMLSVLVLALAAVAGWLTYKESGFGWIAHLLRAVKDLQSLLPLSNK
jgi:hypothetical protein